VMFIFLFSLPNMDFMEESGQTDSLQSSRLLLKKFERVGELTRGCSGWEQ